MILWRLYWVLSNKNRDDGGGGQNCQKLRDVIYLRPLRPTVWLKSNMKNRAEPKRGTSIKDDLKPNKNRSPFWIHPNLNNWVGIAFSFGVPPRKVDLAIECYWCLTVQAINWSGNTEQGKCQHTNEYPFFEVLISCYFVVWEKRPIQPGTHS